LHSSKKNILLIKVQNTANKFHDRALYGQFNAYLSLNKPVDGRTCYETFKDRLESNQDLSCRLQLGLIEDHPNDVLKM
jgi:hypothetical protein